MGFEKRSWWGRWDLPTLPAIMQPTRQTKPELQAAAKQIAHSALQYMTRAATRQAARGYRWRNMLRRKVHP